MIKVWKDKSNDKKLKTPIVRLVGKDLIAVDKEGKFIAYLFDFENMTAPDVARECLTSEGYRVDFAKWDNEGRMTGLLESFSEE